MIIEQLSLRSFKGFSDFSVDLEQFTVLAGGNSNGKTTILQAVSLLHDFIGTTLAPDGTLTRIPNLSGNPDHLMARANAGDPDAVWLLKRTNEPCYLTASYSGGLSVELSITAKQQYELRIRRGERSLGSGTNEEGDAEAIRRLVSFSPLFVPPIGGLSATEQRLTDPALRRELSAGRTFHVWRNNLYWLLELGKKQEFDKVTRLARIMHDVPGRRTKRRHG